MKFIINGILTGLLILIGLGIIGLLLIRWIITTTDVSVPIIFAFLLLAIGFIISEFHRLSNKGT